MAALAGLNCWLGCTEDGRELVAVMEAIFAPVKWADNNLLGKAAI